MTHPVTFPPSQTTGHTPFTDHTLQGLFAAPWMGQPSEREVARVAELSQEWIRAAADPEDLALSLGHLLAVRSHCLRAARARDVTAIRNHYGAARKECETVLNKLHHAAGGAPGALAAWAGGVYTLIQAQLSMPDDPEQALSLARQAMHQLVTIDDPLCSGAKADANSALSLSTEPAVIVQRLDSLPGQMVSEDTHIRAKVSARETLLNERLEVVHAQHDRAMKAVLAWGAVNLLLVASLPLNGFIRPDLAWSLPFVVAVPILWWWTWDRPFRDELPFFGWVRMIRLQSIAEFHAAADGLPEPAVEFHSELTALLARGRTDRERLQAFCLFAMPARLDTVGEAETMGRYAQAAMKGDWLAEMRDRHPMKMTDLLPVEPSLVPNMIRVWYGTSDH